MADLLDRDGRGKFFLCYLAPLLLYCWLIFWLSAQSDPESISPFPFPDKIAHLIEYAGFGFLLMRLLAARFPQGEPVTFLVWVLSGALLYGLSDEMHQYYVPGREFSWMDLLADGAGAYLGARGWMTLKKSRS
ncbi:MAG: VanZ family protein [Deltaproteobacteria bacterium]|nr:VanZ family protein [Deltaproteobacteria bacterium]